MNKLLGLALLASASLFALTANAADLIPVAPRILPPPPAAVYNWSGFYVGGTIGYTSFNTDVSDVLFDGLTGPVSGFSYDGNGIIGGVEAGANAQFGAFVLGIEGDFSWSGAEGEYTDAVNAFTATTRLQSLGTVRGRVGVAMDRVLLFATGGVAFGQIEGELEDVYGLTTITTTDSHTHVGWTVGGGLEYGLTDHVTVKAEGLYYDLGSEDYSFAEGAPGPDVITSKASLTGWVARVGANFKF